MRTSLEDCATAATSNDARDKYFMSYISEVGSCSSKALRSELPAVFDKKVDEVRLAISKVQKAQRAAEQAFDMSAVLKYMRSIYCGAAPAQV